MQPPTIDDVSAAERRIAGLIVTTPLVESPDLSAAAGRRVLLKAETMQRTGSFKYRGAANFLSLLGEVRSAGVAAYSSGNHAQAVAAAAAHFGVPATIVMPSDAPDVKKRRTLAWGAEVIEYDRALGGREAMTAELAARTGATVVPPYEHSWTIAGQGTCGLEIAAQCAAAGIAEADVLVPTGGGGLTAGIALGLSEALPGARVHTVEPAGFDDYARSLEAGERVSNERTGGSICDSLLAPTPGAIGFEVGRRLLAGSVVVSDDEALAAVRHAFEVLRMVVEPGGAVGLAALLAGRAPGTGPLVIVLSGGNVDPAMLSD